MSAEQLRERLHRSIQENLHDSDSVGGNVVTGWVVVAESLAPNGERWLSRIDGGPGGNRLAEWQREGFLHNALHGGHWERDESQDDD